MKNQKIYQLGRDEAYKGMGTTLEALAIIDNQAIYTHIGDSRIGLIRGEEYHQLTVIILWLMNCPKAGQLTPEAMGLTYTEEYYRSLSDKKMRFNWI